MHGGITRRIEGEMIMEYWLIFAYWFLSGLAAAYASGRWGGLDPSDNADMPVLVALYMFGFLWPLALLLYGVPFAVAKYARKEKKNND